MDALKSAGRAIIKSPGIPRHTWGTSKHEKLPENWTDTKETLMEGMAFSVKYLGMTLVEQPKGEEMASAAIRRIVSTARASAKKFQKVTLKVSPRGIILTDTETNELIDNVSIYRISYCTADKAQDKVFAYVAQSQFNETLECHAFLCPKKKIAQAVTLTVAQAFKVALDLWETAQEDKSKKVHSYCSCSAVESNSGTKNHCVPGAEKTNGRSNEEQLRKPFFSSSIHQSTSQHNTPDRQPPVKQDSWDVDDGLDDAFSSNVDGANTATDWQSPGPEISVRMPLSTGAPSSD
ncbi:low density lipoprotein receptor adapter protein 1-like isoform X1 [Acipenser oxyrinchus oxyrinchus]|uniref:Low density lipoprotein receptor adapter protein 1-like isoform X1 n=1 Tax=Acipenser oxyrinchus oxyrinchus TaxID=40147 RepID=A0AAD8GA31_ACIOX|nr:low density lipoprotein receptor adapter protein 1-like isoform X1 [Acipenser oxyrinchus oxyrinchus]